MNKKKGAIDMATRKKGVEKKATMDQKEIEVLRGEISLIFFGRLMMGLSVAPQMN